MIPFTADVDQMIAGPQHFQYAYNDTSMVVRQIRDVKPSPDGKRLAFVALDRVWTMDLPNGTPKRLTTETRRAVPARVVARWTVHRLRHVERHRRRHRVAHARRRIGRPEKLTSKPAYYEKPAYSNDGQRIVVGRGPRNMHKDLREDERPPAAAVGVELVWLPGNGGTETVIAPISNFGRPHFVKSRSRSRVLRRRHAARVDALGRHRSEDDSALGRRWWSAVAAVAAVAPAR